MLSGETRCAKKSLAVHRDAVKTDAIALDEHYLEFSLILNPFDKEDMAIIALILQLENNADKLHLTEFAERIALLLKHDWQRAKWEAEGNWFPSDVDPEPRRVTYSEFKRRGLGEHA